MPKLNIRINPWRGLITAVAVILIWLGSLVLFLIQDIKTLSVFTITLMMLWQTFLYTGLFITAHDAMHGIVLPGNDLVNKSVGRIAVLLYALFSWQNLLKKHHQHHASPASAEDPDFHDGKYRGFWMWYIHFLKNYITWIQLAGMAAVFNLLQHLAGIPLANLLLFWVAPALLSTVQLFYFGTFLPHRETDQPYKDRHRARSNDFNVLLSFLTCYHFGYHWEHHEYPYIPWWKLPQVRRMQKI